MKKILILLFVGAVALMGYRDGGDVTAAIILGLFALPGLVEKKDPSTALRMTKRREKCNAK